MLISNDIFTKLSWHAVNINKKYKVIFSKKNENFKFRENIEEKIKTSVDYQKRNNLYEFQIKILKGK